MLAAATLAVYGQTFTHDFLTYDDTTYVVDNPRVRGGLTLENIAWALSTRHASNWHPLTWLSHMADCTLYGLTPGGHHGTSLFFHILNSLLLFLVLVKMTGASVRSGFVAALFALLPLHVESVAWIAERKDVLSTFFLMLTLWSYAGFAARPSWKCSLLTAVLFAAGLAAKPMLVTLPFALLLLDFWPLKRLHGHAPAAHTGQRKKRARPHPAEQKKPATRVAMLILEKLPLFALAAASCVITYTAQQHGGSVHTLEEYPFGVRLANALAAYAAYLGKMLWPRDLAIFYPHPGLPPLWRIAVAAGILSAISFFAVRVRKTYPYVLAGWLWYLGTLVPVIGLVQVGSQAMADRYTYVPLIGIFIACVWGVHGVFNRHPLLLRAAAGAGLVLIALFSIRTWHQLSPWQNSITVYEHALAVTENNYIVHYNLGNLLGRQGAADAAMRHYREALRIKPGYVYARNNLGVELMQKNRMDEALEHFVEALRIRPDYPEARYNLGLAQLNTGLVDEAIVSFEKALRLKPDYAEAHYDLAAALMKKGDRTAAQEHVREAVRLNPSLMNLPGVGMQ